MVINSKIYGVFAKNIIAKKTKFTILNIVKGFAFCTEIPNWRIF